ncbi:hypothetical protein [Tumebacillus flagellatus]|uniref:Uncharacterized protein n=1 Tax=Tumebacillus flagellatus TaxID=1157490 RepID=A0A074LRK9_9BACL|nr:hypothetical protein [Tumebacillus flagellatus]KEO84776.1 hypothetical protein EL26_01835 [Tumebacillus flagellatus]
MWFFLFEDEAPQPRTTRKRAAKTGLTDESLCEGFDTRLRDRLEDAIRDRRETVLDRYKPIDLEKARIVAYKLKSSTYTFGDKYEVMLRLRTLHGNPREWWSWCTLSLHAARGSDVVGPWPMTIKDERWIPQFHWESVEEIAAYRNRPGGDIDRQAKWEQKQSSARKRMEG